MDIDNVKLLITCDVNYIEEPLTQFVAKNSTSSTFPELNNNDMRQDLWNCLLTHIENEQCINVHGLCLNAIRILSRDKTKLDDMIKEKWVTLILTKANLKDSIKGIKHEIIIDAQKCLSNVLFNSAVARVYAVKNGAVEGIMNRLKKFRDSDLPDEVKYFDMRLLFVLTALHEEIRPKIREELHGLTYLIEALNFINETQTTLASPQCDVSSEILKVLFNIVLKSLSNDIDEEELSHYTKLVIVLRQLLLKQTDSVDKQIQLQSSIINLLTNLPVESLKELYTAVNDSETKLPKNLEFEDNNMSAVHEILMFLKTRLEDSTDSVIKQEMLSPVLIVLFNCTMCNKILRKYLRREILPPLKDVHTRPEQGNTLRNYLCRLLTTPNTQVRDLVAELLFILCKENVSRMIKYTGYGNAAGLFANRGLMGRNQKQDSVYSSDSENSDTEEFLQFKHGINPVVGCYEPPHPNPTEGMSEEQKEYEAMKLVNLMDALTKQGLVQPCKIGEDGRPEPIEHVMQLQEELPRQQVRRENGDSDDD